MLSPTLAKLFSVNLQITVKVVVVVAVLVVMTRLTIDNQEKYFMIILLDLRFKFCLNSSWIWFHKLTPQEIKRGMASQLASYTVYDIWNIPLQSAATKCVYIIARFSKWAIPEKIQMGLGGSGYTFLKTWSFSFFYFWKFQTKQSSNPGIFHKIVLDPLKIPRPKTKTPGNSTSVLINTWKFHMLIGIFTGGIFLLDEGRGPDKEWFWQFQPFSKLLKTADCS